MKLTRKDFEGLEVGTEIICDNSIFTFQAILADTVFVLSGSNRSLVYSVHELNTENAIIQKPKQYYGGWEVRSYEGQNVWVFLSDTKGVNFFSATKLIEVTIDGFVDSSLNTWKYALQLTEVNTTPMCDETKK
jgi:hypothetical protein